MANPHNGDARRTHGDKLQRMVGKRGEYPPDRAARIGHQGANQPAKGDATKVADQGLKIGAPEHQVTNRDLSKVK